MGRVQNEIIQSTIRHKLAQARELRDIFLATEASVQQYTQQREGLEQDVRARQDVEEADIRRHRKCDILRYTAVALEGFAKNSKQAFDGLIATAALRFLQSHEYAPPHEADIAVWQHRLDAECTAIRARITHSEVFCDALAEWLRGSTSSPGSSVVVEEEDVHAAYPPASSTFEPMQYLRDRSVDEAIIYEFKELAKATSEYGGHLVSPDYEIDEQDVSSAIMDLARNARLYPLQIRQDLEQLAKNDEVVSELSAMFSASWHSLSRWQWSSTGISRVTQVHLSGKRREFLDLEMTEAIFVQMAGCIWSKFFHDKLRHIHQQKSWPKRMELDNFKDADFHATGKMIKILREAKIGPDFHLPLNGLEQARIRRTTSSYLEVLSPEGFYEETTSLQSDESTGWESFKDASRTVGAYADIFRYLTGDIALTRGVAPRLGMGVLHADLADFGPSIPHHVCLSVLRFFGIPPIWLDWFKRYLSVPLQASGGETHISARGTPFGLSPSLLVGELALVLLDVALAFETKGLTVHRHHDDFWLWSANPAEIGTAWSAMKEYAEATGLSWNVEKTGYTLIKGSESAVAPAGMPQQRLQWGMLELHEDAIWRPSELLLEKQISGFQRDLRRFLVSEEPFLSVVNLWNQYQSYLYRNIGPPSKITGLDHIKLTREILHRFRTEALRMHPPLFADTAEHSSEPTNTPLGLLRRVFSDRLPQHSFYMLTEAVTSWPAALGGLNLYNYEWICLVHREALRKESAKRDDAKDVILGAEYERTAKLYSAFRAAWLSPEGRHAFEVAKMSTDPKLATWTRQQDQSRPFVSEESFLRWSILSDTSWNAAYDKDSESLDFDLGALKSMARSLCDPFLEPSFGSKDNLVTDTFIPKSAIGVLEAGARDVYLKL